MNPEVEKLVERLKNDFAPYWERQAKTALTPEVARAYYARAQQAREAATTLQSLTARIAELEGALRAAKIEIAALKEAAYGED